MRNTMICILSLAALTFTASGEAATSANKTAGGGEFSDWWRNFGDATLCELIGAGVGNNHDVRAAAQRIEAAAQAARSTRAGYSPTFGITTGWSAQRTSADMTSMTTHSTTMSYFNLGLSMNWEIDVFGRIAAQSKADKASYGASVADYEAVLVSLQANIAKAYFTLRAAQAELAVSNNNIANARELLRIANTRYEVGLVPSVDVLQAEIVVMQTQAAVPSLKAQIVAAINQLALLTAQSADNLAYLEQTSALPTPPLPAEIDDPMTLIRKRPDIVEAERQLDAVAARVGIARKDYMPTLSVQAGVGTEAHNLRNLFGPGSLYYTVMPTLTWTIFDGLGREARINEAKAEMQAQTEAFNTTLATAVGELNTVRAQWQSDVEQLAIYKKILNDARKELELQTDRYKQGLTDFTDVANAQTTVLQAEDSVIESQAAQLAALVAIYTALGGV